MKTIKSCLSARMEKMRCDELGGKAEKPDAQMKWNVMGSVWMQVGVNVRDKTRDVL